MEKLVIKISVFILSVLMISCAEEDTQSALNLDNESSKSSNLLLSEAQVLKIHDLEATKTSSNSDKIQYVYTMTNDASNNEIVVFESSSNGSITEKESYSTGGTGSGGGLSNQGAIALSESGDFLFTVNAGSNELSAFYSGSNGELQLIDIINSGGETPISVTVSDNVVYVLNAGGNGNITGFGFNREGELYEIENSERSLGSNSAGAAQVSFSSNGKALVVTEKATNSITSYAVNNYGIAGEPQTVPSAGVTPFGFDFGNNNVFFVSEAAGGAAGESTVSAYEVSNSGEVSLLQGPLPTEGSAACWVVATKNAKTLFTTNTGGNDISSLAVSGRAGLNLSNDGERTPTGTAPTDAAVDSKSQYLYVLASKDGSIVSYRIGKNGAISQIDVDNGIGLTASGLVVK